jgi:hypothetical protein
MGRRLSGNGTLGRDAIGGSLMDTSNERNDSYGFDDHMCFTDGKFGRQMGKGMGGIKCTSQHGFDGSRYICALFTQHAQILNSLCPLYAAYPILIQSITVSASDLLEH